MAKHLERAGEFLVARFIEGTDPRTNLYFDEDLVLQHPPQPAHGKPQAIKAVHKFE